MAVVLVSNEKTEEPKVEEVAAPEPEKKDKHAPSERISTLAAQRREALAEAAEAKKERDELKKRLDAIENKASEDEPKPDKFTDAVEFGKAYGKWLAAKERKEDQARNAAEREQAEQKKLIDSWNKRYTKVAREYEDFEEVMADKLEIAHGTVIDAIMESDIGPHINYYLSKNREEAEKINEMGVKAALKYLGRIEARIESELESKAEARKAAKDEDGTPRRRLPEPPAPINPVRGIGATGLGNVDSSGNVTNARAFKQEMRKKMYGY